MRRPDDLLPVLEAAALVDRSLSTLRAWIRAGELTGYRESEKQNGRLLVSRSELLTLAAVGGLPLNPGRRPADAEPVSAPPPSAPPERVLEALLDSQRVALAALEARAAAERESAEAWKGRALAAEAEASALRELLRAEQGRGFWARLLGPPKLPGPPS